MEYNNDMYINQTKKDTEICNNTNIETNNSYKSDLKLEQSNLIYELKLLSEKF
jgi:hypothetical protein